MTLGKFVVQEKSKTMYMCSFNRQEGWQKFFFGWAGAMGESNSRSNSAYPYSWERQVRQYGNTATTPSIIPGQKSETSEPHEIVGSQIIYSTSPLCLRFISFLFVMKWTAAGG